MECTPLETQNTSVVKETEASPGTRGGKYLTFGLASEQYGLEILKVQEIIGIMNVTRIPGSPQFVRGVINLRGKVIPVVDLRLTFGIEGKEDTERTCIIVTQVSRTSHTVTMGIIVDDVSEVMDIIGDQIEPTPEFGSSVDTGFILAMAKVGEKVLTLLDIDRVLSSEEISSLGKVA